MATRDSAPPTEETLSAIVNCVCPECGGAIVPEKNEFRCHGLCGRDWRPVWDRANERGQELDAPATHGRTSEIH